MLVNDSFAIHTLQSLISSLDVAISVINIKGEIVYWNEVAEKTYQIKKDEIIGHNIQDFFRKEDIMHLKVLETKLPVRDLYHIPRPDKHVLINTSLIYDENNELIGSLSVEKDITSTIKLNEKLTSTSNELQQLKQKMILHHRDEPFNKIKGKNAAFQQIIYTVKKVAKTDATILLSGESGVGKELFAHAIHEKSHRNEQPFVPINCGAIPNTLFESELFGYESGSYTGAAKGGKPGKIELADGGTLFLDEVGELPLDMQVKLLRAIQEKEIYRIGGLLPKKVNVRIIAATNRVLEEMVAEGTFRADLYYRLNVVSVCIPPLRERIDDIPYLVYDFINEFALKYHKPNLTIHKEAVDRLKDYHWPGNIREFRNIIERLVLLNEGEEITEIAISQIFPKENAVLISSETHNLSLTSEKEQLEKIRIQQILKNTYGNKSAAARKLGMSRVSLYKKIKKYRIFIEKEENTVGG